MCARSIFAPVSLDGLKLRNRIIRSATWEALADESGHMFKELYGIYDGPARGGVGAIITGFTSVSRNDDYVYGAVKLCDDVLIPEHARLIDVVHTHDCPVIVQLALGEYFLSQWVSSVRNGGRLIADIVHDIRGSLPDMHISMKINGSDSLKVCREVEGLNTVEVSGNGTSRAGIRAEVNEAYFRDVALRNAGNILCLSISRPLIHEPDLTSRWEGGDLRPSGCISCNMCYRTPAHRCIFAL